KVCKYSDWNWLLKHMTSPEISASTSLNGSIGCLQNFACAVDSDICKRHRLLSAPQVHGWIKALLMDLLPCMELLHLCPSVRANALSSYATVSFPPSL